MAERTHDNELYDNHGEIELGGSSNAYTATTARAITGYYKGLRISGKANHTNTGAATLAVNDLSAAAIRKETSAVLVAGDIVSGQYYDFMYDDANSRFQLLNPSVPTNAGDADTLDGFDTSASGNRWGVIPVVSNDGVMEVGRYIDFHNSDGDTGDAANRLETNGGTVGLFESPNLGALKRIVSLTNSSLAQGDVIYYDGTNFVRLVPGTSGQFLQTNGAGANPAWASTGPTIVGPTATTSGTTVDFTGIPSGVSRISVNLFGVSLSGSDELLLQIGDSGGIETTGYVSTSSFLGGSLGTSTTGFYMRGGNATDARYGSVTLRRVSTNDWVAEGIVRLSTGAISGTAGGKTLSAGPLDRLRLVPTGANTFDAGSVSIIYD